MTDSNRIKVAKKFIQHFANNEHEVLPTLLADDLLYTFPPSRAMEYGRPHEGIPRQIRLHWIQRGHGFRHDRLPCEGHPVYRK